MADDRNSPQPGYLRVPFRGVAVASAAIGLSCLAVLAVVASIKNVDTLSTVALAVAVVAFVAQLIVFVVQIGAANAQTLQSQELHSQLLSVLTEIRHSTEETRAVTDRRTEEMREVAQRSIEGMQQAVMRTFDATLAAALGDAQRPKPPSDDAGTGV